MFSGKSFYVSLLLAIAILLASGCKDKDKFYFPPNQPPEISAIPDQNAGLDIAFVFDLAPYVTDDYSSGKLVFSVVSGGGSFNGPVYINSFTLLSTNSVQFLVTDTHSATATGMFDVIVFPSPIPDFTVNSQVGIISEPFQFTNLSTGTITDYEWDFENDGTADSTAENPTHLYTTSGIYTVALTVQGPAVSRNKIKIDYIFAYEDDGVHVDDTNGDDNNLGLTWSDPVKSIQKGLDIALDTGSWHVLVADGTYSGTSNNDLDFGGKAIHVMSAYGPASCIIECDTSWGFHFRNGEGTDSVVEGFTISNGGGITDGGGVYVDSLCGPEFINCVITGSAAENGGGIYCAANSNPAFTDCIISNNTATSAGGAIYCVANCSPSFTDCIISDNTATTGGGGVYFEDNGDPRFTNCTFSGNSADKGGAVYLNHNDDEPTDPTFIGCTFSGNSANDGGSVFICDESYTKFIDCVISGNSATEGGGVFTEDYAQPIMINCLITGNSATGNGGASYSYYDSGAYINCTIVGNSADNGGGFYVVSDGNPYIGNCILWSNTAATSGHQIYIGTGPDLTLMYSCYSNSTNDIAGPGAITPTDYINSDPLFVTGPKGDYYLSQIAAGQGTDSPCLDAGTDHSINQDWSDKTTRIDAELDSGQIDMGYHYDP